MRYSVIRIPFAVLVDWRAQLEGNSPDKPDRCEKSHHAEENNLDRLARCRQWKQHTM